MRVPAPFLVSQFLIKKQYRMPNAGRRILKWTRLQAQFEIHHSSIDVIHSTLKKTVFRNSLSRPGFT